MAEIFVGRGLEPALAKQVAVQLMAHDALEAYARDELGFTETLRARPIQTAIVSTVSFSAGAVVPLIAAAIIFLSGRRRFRVGDVSHLPGGSGRAGGPHPRGECGDWDNPRRVMGSPCDGCDRGLGVVFGTIV